ncbi:hypothetical protein [Cellulomonas fengjieae]|uniref:Ribosomally synthesized peptide with SipW-like signal peptide n=1 Tax=Cellulomonas fengjieae TaxID=2819978 RepID=A0ABS3SBF2_9CELL|nr:hypothetical protein [Cellulomonas fengjieae]MBO3083073.1 hypothetical protein [Cellulomonas fengjieae]QVI65558.1 hypothetical protein KG102_15895 [Cellulomonas fengjieae]
MTTSTTDVVVTDQDRDKRRRRAAIARFGLAGVAVLGVGAAATSAAWTDDAWFAGSASAVEKVELQASVDGGNTWYDADTTGEAVQIPADAFANLNQGADETIALQLKNVSSVPLTLGRGVLTTDGALFAGSAPATATIHDPSSFELAAGATDTVMLQVTTPDDWPAEYQGAQGTMTVQFTGES